VSAAPGASLPAAPARPPGAGRRPPEHELLLHCARVALSPGGAARVRALASEDLDWEELVALAERHGLVAFLHRHLVAGPVAAPEAAASALRARFREQARRALALAGELRRLLDALSGAGVAALAYKGPALAVQAYGDLSLRRFTDLDLLVRPDDAPRALAVLAGEGYDPVKRLSPAQDAAFRRVDGDYQLLHRRTRALVELHCRVHSRRFGVPLETAELMRRARPVPLGGGEVPAPCPDDALLVACVHGGKHRWNRLEWVSAVAGLLRGGSADAAAVLDRAGELHARRTVLLGLALARGLLDAPVPPAAVAEIEGDAGIAALVEESERRMFAPTAVEVEGEETAANLVYNLRLRDRPTDRARYAWRWLTLPSPEDWEWRPLPDALFPLYRVLRPLRLALRYGRRAVGR
jgi:hypothetical protein